MVMIAGLAAPIALAGSAQARAALRSKWLYESLPLSFLLSPSQMAMDMQEDCVRLTALPFWQFEARATVASATARFAVPMPDAGGGRRSNESSTSGSSSGLRTWERRNVENLENARDSAVGKTVMLEEVYAGYELPPGSASIVLAPTYPTYRDGERHNHQFGALHAIPRSLDGIVRIADRKQRNGVDADADADADDDADAEGDARRRASGAAAAAATNGDDSDDSNKSNGFVFDVPHMSEDMAWSFVLRRLRRRFADAIFKDAMRHGGSNGGRASNASTVAAVSCSLDVERRGARLVAYPAYIFNYNFEKRYGSSGDVEDVPFTAVVGANNGAVSAVQHVCSSRSRVAGGIAGGIGAGVFCGWAAPEMGTVAAEVTASAIIASLSAGAVASRVPVNAWRKIDTLRENEDQRVLQGWEAVRESIGCDRSRERLDWREEEAFSRVWEDAEWRRWNQPDEWFGWNPKQRQEWAEQLYRRHMQSERQRYEKRIEDAMAARQAEADAAREQRKRARFGEEAFGEKAGSSIFGEGFRVDPHGYLGLLGLDRTKAPSVDAIKAAFRKEALKLHPDMNSASSRADDAAFQKLHHAYTELMTAAAAADASGGVR